MRTKKAKLIVTILIIATAAALGIIGYLVLPDVLVMQVTFSGENGTTMPKLLGLLIPLAVSTIFSVRYYTAKNEGKNLLLSLLGLAMYALVFIFNI